MDRTSKKLVWIEVISVMLIAALIIVFNYDRISVLWGQNNDRQQLTPASDCFHNIILMDQSGSMSFMRNTAIKGAREVMESIKAANDTIQDATQNLTLVFFDGDGRLHLNYVVDNQPITDAEADLEQYLPRGITPLYDAIGTVINNHLPKVDSKDFVMMTIITDGLENASKEYSASNIKALVESLSAKNWSFTYIGANQDAIHEGERIGIRDSHNYENTHEGYGYMISGENYRRNSAISRIVSESRRKKNK